MKGLYLYGYSDSDRTCICDTMKYDTALYLVVPSSVRLYRD